MQFCSKHVAAVHQQNGHAQAGAHVDTTILSAPNSAIVQEMRTDFRTRNPLELEKMRKRSNVRSNDLCDMYVA